MSTNLNSSPEFLEVLTNEIDRMEAGLSVARMLRRQITGEVDGEQAITLANRTTRAAIAPRKAAASTAPATKQPITPEQLASRQLQGRYLGLIRQFPKSRRGEFQKIAKEKSREAAITAMQRAKKAAGQPGKPTSSRVASKVVKAKATKRAPRPARSARKPAVAAATTALTTTLTPQES